MELREYNRLLHQIGRMHHTLCENTASSLDIHRSQHMLLMHIFRRPGQTQKELAEALRITPAAVAVSLKKLETEGYIQRLSLVDGRTNQIYITQKGEDVAEATKRLFDSIDEKMFSSLTEEEFDALYRILGKIEANLQQTIKEEKNAL